MIGPKKKISIAKKHSRHGTWETLQIKKMVAKNQITSCNHCGQTKRLHRVCPHCGWYKGKQVLTIVTKGSDDVVSA